MPKDLLARDIMVPIADYSTVHEDDSLRQAIYTLRTSFQRDRSGAFHGHRALLVLDNTGNISGIITLLDLLKAVELNEHFNDPWIKAASWSWYFINRVREVEGIKVKEFMRPIFLVTVNSDQPVQVAIKKMLAQEEDLIAVLEKKLPVGLIRTVDIFWALSKLL